MILWRTILVCLCAWSMLGAAARGESGRYFVDPVNGDDNASGTDSTRPFKTLARGVAALKAGDVLQLAPRAYTEPLVIRRSGAPGRPIIIEGNGAVIDLATDVNAGPWQAGNGYYVLDRNIAPLHDLFQTCALFVDGEPMRDYRDGQWRPGRCTIADGRYRLALPLGKKIGACSIALTTPAKNAVDIANCQFVTIRDLTARGAGDDGFNLWGRTEAIRLERVRALSNGDEGISAHQDVQLEVEDAEIAFNGSAAGGVADVHQSRTAYRRCIVHHNRAAGFYFSNAAAVVETCVTFANGGPMINTREKPELIARDNMDLAELDADSITKLAGPLRELVERAKQIHAPTPARNP